MTGRPLDTGDGRRAAGLARLARLWRARQAERASGPARQILPAVLARLVDADPEAAAWTGRLVRAGDPCLFALSRPGAPARAFVRIARSGSAVGGIVAAETALTVLRQAVPAPAAERLPEPLASGLASGFRWFAEAALDGAPAPDPLIDPTVRQRALAAVQQAIAPIHAVATRAVVGDAQLGPWVDARIVVVAQALGGSPSDAGQTALRRLGDRLRARLAGAELEVGWIHGDLWLDNVLFDPSGERVVAVVDWDSASPTELALQDRLHLALTTRRRAERRHLGPLVADLLRDRQWAAGDRAALGLAADEDGSWDLPIDALDGLEPATALGLYWLRFVEVNLVRHPGLAADRTWLAENVARVAACL